jgi:glycogen synthase
MKIFICASKYNYGYVADIKEELEKMGHDVTVPNSYDEPMKEEEIKKISKEEHYKWKKDMINLQKEKVDANDCVLVLNFEKNGQPNYIGGATFLEIFRAFDSGKPAYLYNSIPECCFTDELIGMGVKVIDGDLTKLTM